MNKISLKIILASLIFFFTFSKSYATENLTPDGFWWEKLSQDAKYGVVVGLIEGYQKGLSEGFIDYPLSHLSRETIKKMGISAFSIPPIFQVQFSHPLITYIHRIDDFHISYPTRKTLDIKEIFPCLSDTMGNGCLESKADPSQNPYLKVFRSTAQKGATK